MCLSKCLSFFRLSAHISQKPHVQASQNFLYLLPGAWLGPPLTLCTSSVMDDVMFSHIGKLHWWCRHGCRVEASSRIFKCICQGAPCCFTLLWSPCVAGADIIFLPWFLSSICLPFFIPCLISAAADCMSTILPHLVWP